MRRQCPGNAAACEEEDTTVSSVSSQQPAHPERHPGARLDTLTQRPGRPICSAVTQGTEGVQERFLIKVVIPEERIRLDESRESVNSGASRPKFTHLDLLKPGVACFAQPQGNQALNRRVGEERA